MIRDFERYFVSLQKDYNKMLKSRDRVNEEIAKGLITEEQREQFEIWCNQVKVNYDRVNYMRYLLHLPPKFIQKIQQRNLDSKMMKELKKFASEHADKDGVLAENKEALDGLNKSIGDDNG
mgnify:CR=1 FL=1